eukprot:TRINITY_DN23495_c0_g2_i1.p1 TRINITY_DN23495_c0_g2~~TRINITY_DN23495_c0_g2_i1.p1  ORF type:complete len:397 (-),score=24.49 TRINITY_DN23495_c0_g2_i1:218-1312(-)
MTWKCWGGCISGSSCIGTPWLTVPPDEDFQLLMGGEEYTCGILSGSFAVKCWGTGWPYQQGILAPPSVPFHSISTGQSQACGIQAGGSGRIKCWGAIASLPPDLSFSAVAAGTAHACGIVDNRSARVACWGSSGFAPPGIRDTRLEPPRTYRFKAITSGRHSSCALTVTGVAMCWGFRLARSMTTTGETVYMPMENGPMGSTFQFISQGFDHVCGILNDGLGNVKCWGSDHHGQTRVPRASTFQTLASGSDYTCGLLADGSGKAVCWGNSELVEFRALVPPADLRFAVLGAGSNHVCAACSASDCLDGNSSTSALPMPTDRPRSPVRQSHFRLPVAQGRRGTLAGFGLILVILSLAAIVKSEGF